MWAGIAEVAAGIAEIDAGVAVIRWRP